ncbi:MAG: ribokinase [Ruminococcaceae bacterium]|nr:ribokinase [Oscillospiraceae bacterium]
MKILNFGSCNVDHVYSMDHIVAPGETQTTYKLEIFPGGKGLNQSIAAARAGAAVYHAGCIGKGGEMLEKILSENGVDLSNVRHVDEQNGHAIIQVGSDGENSIFLYPGSNEMITEEHINSALEGFGKGDLLILQNEINNLETIVEKAYEKGISILLNPAPFNEKIKALKLSHLTYIILNETEAKGLTGTDEPEKCLDYFETEYPELRVMLTLGEKGSVYMENGKKTYREAFKVKAVDTTAAGDTFTGYFAAGLSEGLDTEEILKRATAASAITVSRMGAAPSVPTAKEVDCFLQNI